MNSRHVEDSDIRNYVSPNSLHCTWINKPVTVVGEDFSYEATCLCSFTKLNGKVRYIVEDRGRLFIQRESQLQWPELDVRDIHQERADREGISRAEAKVKNYGEAYGIDPKGNSKLLGPKPEEPVTLAVLDDMENELAGRPSQTIGEALELQYNRERNKGDDPLGR